MEAIKGLRVPIFLLGLALIFASERYLTLYPSYRYITLGAWIISILPVLTCILFYRKAKARGTSNEARSWLYLCLWQSVVLAGAALYYPYKWQLEKLADSNSLILKVLIVIWLSLVVIGLFTGLGLELAHRTNGEGETAEPNRLKWSGAGWLGIGLLFSGLFALNYGTAHKDQVFDLSYFKTTRPGDSTLKIAEGLTDPIKIGLFFAKDSEVLPFVRPYIDTIAQKNSKIEVGVYDKDYFPLQAEEFRASRNGVIIIQKGDQRQKVDLGDQLEGARKKLRKLDVDFQKALVSLIEPPRVAYFTRTHGEMSWLEVANRSPFRAIRGFEGLLRSQNISSRSITNVFAAAPVDAAMVAIVGPVGTLGIEEVKVLREYVDKGGKVLIALDIESAGESPEGIQTGDQQPLLDWLEEMGISYQKTPLVNDKEYVSMGRDNELTRMFLFSNVFGSHESVTTLTRNDDKLNVLYFQSGYFDIKAPQNEWKTVATMMSTKNTFADKNKNLKFDESEARSSYPVAAAAEKTLADGKKAQVVAFADATLLSDALMTYNGNQFIALDTIRWLNGRSETAGEVESEEDVKIQHSRGRELFVFHGSIYLIPVIIIGLGFITNRRKRVRS